MDTFSNQTVTIDADTSGFRREMQLSIAQNREFTAEVSRSTQAGRQFGRALGTAFDGLVFKGRSLGDTIRTLGMNLSRIAFNAAFKPLENALGNMLSSAVSGGSLPFATGGVLQPGTPTPFAKGGVIASPMTFPLSGGTGLAGERGAEAILPLARGPDGSLGVAASGGGGMSVTFNVTAADADSFRRSESQITALLARAVGSGQRNL